MTQFMKLLLVGTITGMVMTTAAIGTAAAAEPENRITILYDAFGKDGSDAKGLGLLGARFPHVVEVEDNYCEGHQNRESLRDSDKPGYCGPGYLQDLLGEPSPTVQAGHGKMNQARADRRIDASPAGLPPFLEPVDEGHYVLVLGTHSSLYPRVRPLRVRAGLSFRLNRKFLVAAASGAGPNASDCAHCV
jgi:hypothetical protein